MSNSELVPNGDVRTPVIQGEWAPVPQEGSGPVFVGQGYGPYGPYGPYGEPEEEGITLRELIAIVVRRRWTIAGVLLVVLLSSIVWCFNTPPTYKATAHIEITPPPQITPFKDAKGANYIPDNKFFQSQMYILKSRGLAQRVVERLNLYKNEAFLAPPKGIGSWFSVVSSTLKDLFNPAPPSQAKEEAKGVAVSNDKMMESLVDKLLAGLTVAPPSKRGGGGSILEISYEGPDPKLCAEIVNTLVDEYIHFDMERRIEGTKLGKKYLERQLAKVQARLEVAQEQLNRFAKENDLVLLRPASGEGKEQGDLISAKLSDLLKQLNEAEAEEITARNRYLYSLKNIDDTAAMRGDTTIASLRAKLEELQRQYSKMSTTFTPKYPAMQELAKEIEAVKKDIAQEREKIVASLRNEYLLAHQKRMSLQKEVEAQKNLASKLEEKAVDYSILKREVETNRKIYDMILTRMKEMEVAAGVQSSAIHPIDAAIVPSSPYKPNKPLTFAIALVLGTILGLLAAVGLEFLDNTVKDPEEVEKMLYLPTLGVVPYVKLPSKKVEKGESVDLISITEPRAPASEAFRMVRTSLLLSSAGKPPQIIAVTSPQIGAGKSFVSLNLALSFAQSKAKVLLVDCDLRRGRLHKVLKEDLYPGLTNYLAGRVERPAIVREVVREDTVIHFVPTGATPPNPVELINSTTFQELLESWREEYDHIIVDTPPLIGFADSLLIARLADGAILALRADQTPKPAAKNARDQLRQVGAKLLGTVVNGMATGRHAYYYSYGKYHGYSHYYSKDYYSGSPYSLPSHG